MGKRKRHNLIICTSVSWKALVILVCQVQIPLKWFRLLHLPSGHRWSILGIVHITLVLLFPQTGCCGRQRPIRNRGWIRAWALENLVNAIRSGRKIPIWALDNTRGSRLRKFRRVTAMGKIGKKVKTSPSLAGYTGGRS